MLLREVFPLSSCVGCHFSRSCHLFSLVSLSGFFRIAHRVPEFSMLLEGLVICQEDGMFASRREAHARKTRPSLLLPPRIRRRMRARALVWPALLPFIVLSGLLLNWTLLIPAAFAAPAASYSVPGHNTFQQFVSEGQRSKASHGPFVRPSSERAALRPQANAKQNNPLPSAEPANMKDQTYLLDDSFVLHRPVMKPSAQPATIQGTVIPAGSTPLIFRGSDGRLELDLPRGSLDFSHATLTDGSAPVGQLFLQIHQRFGHYIEADSILGTYQIQIVDSMGHAIQGVVLTHPATVVYHYQDREMQELNLNPDHVYLAWPDLLNAAQTAKRSTAGLAASMTNNPTAHTLTAQTTVLGGVLTASGTPEIAAPTTPDLFEARGNNGQYSYSRSE